MTLDKRLRTYCDKYGIDKKKGHLSLVLVVTHHAQEMGLPLDPAALLTGNKGQVKGLGKASVQSILKRHGIGRVLAAEGGRTSRGSINHMTSYVAFLNDLNEEMQFDVADIQRWWIERVKEFFSKVPFKLNYDPSLSCRTIISNLLEQARKRQDEASGYMYVGMMLQHLVGAKLRLLIDNSVEIHGASVADEVTGRSGDFIIEDVVIHVTTSPSESLLDKCRQNIENGSRAVIITIGRGLDMALGMADRCGILDRIDVFEAEQFLAGNIYELGQFGQKGRRLTAEQLVAAYNEIVEECETDPSMRIEMTR